MSPLRPRHLCSGLVAPMLLRTVAAVGCFYAGPATPANANHLFGRIRLGPDAVPHPHRVVLHLCELEDAAAGGSVEVVIQGRTMASHLAVRGRAGGANRTFVSEFDVTAGPLLTLDLRPTSPRRASIRGVEIVRE